MSRTILPLAALALVALVCTACSGTPAASVAGNDGGSANAAHEQAVKFSACMRANGVSDFPDPNASGAFTIDAIANGSSIDTNSPAFTRAITTCRDLEPAGFTGTTRTPEQQQAALTFAQCIRDNGVKDFPDPAIDEPLIDTTRIPSTDTPGGMTILRAAMQKCTGLARAAGVQP
jgi:hypothetical protein